MRNLLAISFILLYGLGLLRPIAPFIEYELNKDYIKEFLCVNKSESITMCGGKCYLVKQLKKSQNQDQTKAGLQINMQDYPVSIDVWSDFVFETWIDRDEHHAVYDEQYYTTYIFPVFHPPTAA